MSITLYSHITAPNGWKIAIVLEELGISYKTVHYNDFAEMKQPDFLRINPNGRIPAIVDHDNGDFVLWESGAIILYLVDRYDKDHKLSYPAGTKENYLVAQWVAFQISGQGPYFGQATWFKYFHSEKLPSAIQRYEKEIDRVTGVLDGVLANQKYLVGDKVTVADLIFIPWNRIADRVGSDSEIDLSKYKNYVRWDAEISARPAVKKCFAKRQELVDAKEAADKAAAK